MYFIPFYNKVSPDVLSFVFHTCTEYDGLWTQPISFKMYFV